MKIEFHFPQYLARKIVFVDGLTRSGKGFLSSIIPSLERMEKINVCELFDMQIIPAMRLGLDEGMAKALVKCQFNELAYNTFLSRNVNFRPGDESSIYNHSRPSLYFERLNSTEDTIMERMSCDWFFPFKTHDLLANREYLDRLDLNYYMIELIRNPIDICYSWYKRGWGHRWATDPRAFALKYKNDAVPYYLLGFEEEWFSMSEKERSIFMPIKQMERCIEQYKKNSERMIVITFEYLVTHTDDAIDKICYFLGTDKTDYTGTAIKVANGNRKLESEQFKVEEYREVRKKYFDMLMTMVDLYNRNRYGIECIG